MEPVLATPAEAIRSQRKAAGISQESLARLANCSTSTVRLVEKGWQPSDEMLDRLKRALIEGPLDQPLKTTKGPATTEPHVQIDRPSREGDRDES